MTSKGNNVELQRILKAPVNRVFRAFGEPEAQAAWMPPFGFTAVVHEMAFKVGGIFRTSFRNFGTGEAHSFGGTFLEIKTDELIRYNDRFDDPNLPGQIEVTIHLKEVPGGTELRILQENIPIAIPVSMCYLGWQNSLVKLAQLVEAEVCQ